MAKSSGLLCVGLVRVDMGSVRERIVADVEARCFPNVAELAIIRATDAVGFNLHLLTVDDDLLARLLRRERRAEHDARRDQCDFFSSSVLHAVASFCVLQTNNTETVRRSREEYR